MRALTSINRRHVGGWCIFALAFLLYFSDAAVAGFFPETRFHHTPPLSVSSGETIPIEAGITDPVGITQVRCYFKYGENEPYLFVEMASSEKGYTCRLPAPAAHVYEIRYLLVAVNADGQTVRTPLFEAAVQGSGGESSLEGSAASLTVQSDIPVDESVSGTLASGKVTLESVADGKERYGLRVGLYDMSRDPDYHYGYWAGFEADPVKNTVIPIKGYTAFPKETKSEEALTPFAETAADSYPNISGDNWSGYWFIVDKYGKRISDNISVRARVERIGSDVEITITSNRGCPGRGFFDHGTINTSGFIWIYDVSCDNELWTTHWTPATSTRIQIMDFVDTTYQKLFVVDLRRPDPTPPVPPPAAPVLVSPANGEVTSFVETLLTWKAVTNAVNYQVLRGPSCTRGTLYQTTALVYGMIHIAPDTVNYWKVRAQNSQGVWGAWSECRWFKTRPLCAACPAVNSLLLGD